MMKTSALVFTAFCALFSTTFAAPGAQDGSDSAKAQHSFHFYDQADKQDEKLVRDLIGRAMQFPLVVPSADTDGMSRDSAKAQHSFHFYDKADKQDEELVRDLIGRAMQLPLVVPSADDTEKVSRDSAKMQRGLTYDKAEIQWWNNLLGKAKGVCNYLNSPKSQEAKDQHSLLSKTEKQQEDIQNLKDAAAMEETEEGDSEVEDDLMSTIERIPGRFQKKMRKLLKMILKTRRRSG